MNLKKGCILGLGLTLALGANAATSKTFSFELRKYSDKAPDGIYPLSPISTAADFAWPAGYDRESVNAKKETPYPLEMILKSVPFPNGTSGDVTVKFEYTSDTGLVLFTNTGVTYQGGWILGNGITVKIIDAKSDTLPSDYVLSANFIGASLFASNGGGALLEDAATGTINGSPISIKIKASATTYSNGSAWLDFPGNPTNQVTWVLDSTKLGVTGIATRGMKINVTTKEAPKLRLIGLGSK